MESRPSTFSYYDVLMKRDYYDVLDKEKGGRRRHAKKKGKRKIGEPATPLDTSLGQNVKAGTQEMSKKTGDTVRGRAIQRLHLRRSSSTPDLGRLTQAGSSSSSNDNKAGSNNKKNKSKSTTVTPASPQTAAPSSDTVSSSFFSPQSTAIKISADKKAFQQVVQLWKREGWPVQLLFKDPTSARLLQDNAVFTAISFYEHEWKWDKGRGLMLYVACDGRAQHQDQTRSRPNMKLVPWNDIKDRITVINAAGWLVFDGVYYGMNGLEGVEGYGNTDKHSDGYRHMWKWRKLPIAYRYPEDQRPNYSYFEIISCSWEHSGFPGFGLERPHGHVSVEFCDTQGNVYSVGQYPDPRGMGTDKMSTIYLTTLGVLMATDPYLSSRGEKSVHRYNLGTGARGQRNFEKLMAHIENIQRCGVLHNGLDNNCSDFAVSMEHFVLEHCDGAVLFDLHQERHFLPQRKIRPRPPRLTRNGSRKQRLKSSALGAYATLYHYVILFLISIVLSLLSLLPVSARLGRGRGVDISSIPTEEVVDDATGNEEEGEEEEEEETDAELQEHLSKELTDMFCNKDEKNFGALRRKWISPLWPRKVRLVQLYGPMRRHSALFMS